MHFKKISRFTIIALFQFMTFSTIAQESNRFAIGINPIVIANVGRSYGVNFQYNVSANFNIYAGGKYQQNFVEEPKLNSQRFRYRFYAGTQLQHVGYNIGLNYKIKWPFSILEPFIYYDVTYFNLDLRTLILTNADTTIDGINYKRNLVTPIKYYNLHTLENNIGLGFTCNFTKRISINSRGGVGANFILNLPKSEYVGGRHVEPSFQYAVGVQYEF